MTIKRIKQNTFPIIIISIIAFLLSIFTHPAFAQNDLSITEFSIPTAYSYPIGIGKGMGNNIWFTESGGNKIGKITTDGIITEYSLPTKDSYPQKITLGSDGNMWFTEISGNKIGKITSSGEITEFAIPTNNSGPSGITSSLDGNIWFTEMWANKIGRISLDGVISEFTIPTANSYPRNIVLGLDGDLWFTEQYGSKIGRITPDGNISEFSLGPISVGPYDIALGPDGNIWVTEYNLIFIDKITSDGNVTKFLVDPTMYYAALYTLGITRDTNNIIWFTGNSIGQSVAIIGNITVDGKTTIYPVGRRGSILSITLGPDNNIWFVDYSGKIGRVNLSSINPTPTPTPAKTPLILIPGIAGSEFKNNQTFTSSIKDCGISPAFTYNTDDVIWVNLIVAGISPCDDYFDVLKLKTDGLTPEYPQIVLNGNIFEGVYGKTIKFFTDNDYELNKDLFVFPYDWRKDISLTAPLLDQRISDVKTQTGSQKIDIVAHSMGGLVARNYISDFSRAQNVRKLFTLGTPHLGSVDFLKNLRFGGCLTAGIWDDFAEKTNICLGVAPLEVKDIIQNMISGYELAPSQEYFNFYNGQDNTHPNPYKTESGALNYTQIKNLLTNLSYNTALFNPSESFHVLDNSLTNSKGVDVTVVAGSGQATLGQIIEEKRISLLGLPYVHKDMVNVNGDKTVPLFSASLNDPSKKLSLLGTTKVFYTNQEHGNLVSSGPALNLVKNILNNDGQLPDGVSAQPYHFGGTRLSVHSPVNIHAYDFSGRHTGPITSGDFEANIPGSSYDTLDDAKFIFLPDDGNYNIKFEATGQGSFDFKIRKFENDINTATVLYNDIPLTTSTKAQTTLDTLSTQPPTLRVDEDGNGTIDKNIDPTFVLTGDAVYDDTPPEANIRFDTLTRDLAVTGLDNLSETSIIQTPISKNKEQFVITDESGNTLILADTNRLHGPSAVFSISSLAYNTLPTVPDTNKLSISYQTDRNNAVKSFVQKFEIKGIVKIQLSYDPKTNTTTVTADRQKSIVDGMKILQVSTGKGSLKYNY